MTFRSSRLSLTSVKSSFQFASVTGLTVHRLSRKKLPIIDELLSLRNQVGTSLKLDDSMIKDPKLTMIIGFGEKSLKGGDIVLKKGKNWITVSILNQGCLMNYESFLNMVYYLTCIYLSKLNMSINFFFLLQRFTTIRSITLLIYALRWRLP